MKSTKNHSDMTLEERCEEIFDTQFSGSENQEYCDDDPKEHAIYETVRECFAAGADWEKVYKIIDALIRKHAAPSEWKKYILVLLEFKSGYENYILFRIPRNRRW